MTASQLQPATKPFLKWPGGKFKLRDRIIAKIGPLTTGTYFEPFLGGAAVALNIEARKKVLGDVNSSLINLYHHVMQVDDFIDYAASFFVPANNTESAFYDLREQLNQTSDSKLKAALTLYVNKHCYNGLMRENRSGEFNTPFGRYKKVTFPKPELLSFKSQLRGAKFVNTSYAKLLKNAKAGDVVYCDPPYAPKSETAYFTSYSREKFGLEQQQELANVAEKLAAKGAKVLISNHDTEFTREIYKGANEISIFPVKRSISCIGDKRDHVDELLAIYQPQ